MDNSRQDILLESVLGAIGNTPLVELCRITLGLEGRILAKLEYLNPGFSKKDRIALQMIEEAESDGSLEPGQTVGGLTSGNTGTGLSIVCAVKGYPAVILAGKPVTNPNHRIQGGGYSMTELSLINKDYIDGYLHVTDEEAMDVTRRLAREEGIFAGFSSGANVAAAMQLLRTTCQGKSIAVLLSDSGLKYLSTDLWQ